MAADTKNNPNNSISLSFCATIIDEWLKHGVRNAFIAPGSRSTPLAVALELDTRISTEVFIDERSCGFAGLGNSLRTQVPSVLLCSSGTAGTHFYAAVVEASLSDIPLIVCTADRPYELHDVSAPQAMNQKNLYGNYVRYFTEPGVPDADQSNTWRSIGSRIAIEALGTHRPGPVHVNLNFREPFLVPGQSSKIQITPAHKDNQPWHNFTQSYSSVHNGLPQQILNTLRSPKGVIIAGKGVTDPNSVTRLAQRFGWPLFAGPRSGCKDATAIRNFDQLLRNESWAEKIQPDFILQIGENLSSKSLNKWIASRSTEIIVANNGRWNDPSRMANHFVSEKGLVFELTSLATFEKDPSWLKLWTSSDQLAENSIQKTILNFNSHLTGPEIAMQVTGQLETDEALVVSSSMPIREIEWFGDSRTDVSVYSNRGANGIDGVISTAIGVSTSGKTTLLIGDIAFLHDNGALLGLAERDLDLTIVVIDNDGGQIFTHLPQSKILNSETFKKLYLTPQKVDLEKLCEAHNIPVSIWSQNISYREALQNFATKGPRVVIADSGSDIELYDAIEKAVSQNIPDSLS